MKVQVRRGVFETNSSSTHSLTMCSKTDYDKWRDGELLLNDSYSLDLKGDFVTREDAVKALKNYKYCPDGLNFDDDEEVNEALRECSIYTYDEYDNVYDEYEWFRQEYETKSGEKVVAFGHYGWDG